MNAELFCSHCQITAVVRWSIMKTHDDVLDPLDEDEREEQEDLYPEHCPFCGSPAENAD